MTGTAGKPGKFGVSMSSTSQGGSGPGMQTGDTLDPSGNARTVSKEKVAKAGGGKAVPDYQATRKPLPQGRCAGKYTEEAKAAGVEGQVKLALTVDADGKVKDIQVKSGLPHGLTEAAIVALKACRFTPGEVDGKPVAVRIEEFKVSFYLQNNQQ